LAFSTAKSRSDRTTLSAEAGKASSGAAPSGVGIA
jgi:hypothetical protein